VDLAVLGQQQGDPAPVPEGLVERVLAGAGRPAIVIPSAGGYADAGKRALVAWTGSREAARALHDALPLLERAESVLVLALQEPREGGVDASGLPPLDLVDHLRTHGVRASYDRWLVGELSAVDAVLNRASDEGADLIVAGAYGLSAAPFDPRHGMTRQIMETMTAPVLLSC
jgi:nucleotide-binding universal stress UspA family protein